MSKSKTCLLVAILGLLVFSNKVHSQENEITRQQLQNMTKFSGNLITKSATETIGSPYLSDDFLQGYIMTNEKARTETTGIRYNMENNEVEFLRNKQIFVTDANKISGFELLGEEKSRNIVFKNRYQTDINEINSNTLLRVVYEGKLKLLVHYKAILLKDISTYATATKKNKYSINKNYYLVTEDKKFHKLELPGKDILNLLSGSEDLLENYFEANDRKLETEYDLIRLLEYYEDKSGK